ncbi:MAG: autotransporter domain-containing protein [Chthoniobacter sp.]
MRRSLAATTATDTRRSALQGEARGDTDGGELNALFGTGYDFKKGNLTFGPTASFNYTYLGTNAFTEHGSLAPLDIHGGKGESLRTALGFKASYDWKIGGLLIKPEIRAACSTSTATRPMPSTPVSPTAPATPSSSTDRSSVATACCWAPASRSSSTNAARLTFTMTANSAGPITSPTASPAAFRIAF